MADLPESKKGLGARWNNFRCRHGHHQMEARPWPLGPGRLPACVQECQRCGVVEDWAGAWDSVVCIGRWRSFDKFLEEHTPPPSKPLVSRIIEAMRDLTDEQRHEIVTSCCTHCGSLNPNCHCWNDD